MNWNITVRHNEERWCAYIQAEYTFRKESLGFGDLVLIFKVAAELSRSNLSVSAERIYVFYENKLASFQQKC